MPTIIVMLTVFVSVAALIGGLMLMFRGDSNSAAEDRLAMLTGNSSKTPGGKESESNLLAHPLDDGASSIEQYFARFLNLRRFLEQADASVTVNQFVLIALGLAGAGAVLAVLFSLPLLLAPLVAASLGVLPGVWLFFKRKKRLNAFAKQLPDALELISRALRAGHSLAAGINLVAEEMSAPIGKEFAKCYEEQNLGIPLEEALEDMTERVPNVDVRFFVTAIVLQRQTGGDLAEILDKIGHLVRERFKIWGQIQALTGEGRLSGVVLLALPPLLFVVMYRINPDYCQSLFTDPLGQQMLGGAIVLQFVGALVIRKIINIKV